MISLLKVLTCIAVEHDPALVALALVFCLVATITAFKLNTRRLESQGPARLAWLALTGVAGGAGIWATHFIGLLAYDTKIPLGYARGATGLSLIVATVSTSLAFQIASSGRRLQTVLGGLLFGAGLATMHYCGMLAFQPKAQLDWDMAMVAASIAVGAGFSIAALLLCATARTLKRQLAGAGLLTMGICGLHFTGMSALTLFPDSTVTPSLELVPRTQMIFDVIGLTSIVLAGAMILIAVDVYGRRQSLQRLKLLFDANPVPMWILQDKTLRFLDVNDAAVTQYGYSRAELNQMTAYDIIHPDNRARVREVIRTNFKGYDGNAIWTHLRADGSEVLVQPFLRPLNHGGESALLTALVDVTAREQATQAMAAAKDAAEASSRAKSDFLANMSHEIRTPLNGVIGVIGVLERTPLDDDQRQMLSVVESSASTLQRILSDVLDVSKMESGELDIRLEPFDLLSAVRSTAALHEPDAKRKGLGYALEIAPSAATHVVGDRHRISQIVGNLLSNAVKFTEAGEIRLTVEAGEGETPTFRFEVTDTGLGFDAGFQSRLFGRFEQADSSITRRFGGSGLGLSIAYALAEQMGGSLTAASSPGRGSSFVLELPLALCEAPAAEPAEPANEQTADVAPLRVLVADDHPVNRHVVDLILRNDNVEITSVEDGAQAVEAYAAQPFDLVLMDLQMPVMDGLEAIRCIRTAENSAGRRPTPTFVLSASAMPEHIEASHQAGASGHLAKPITAAALLECVASVRDERRRSKAA